jgi:hypothetical protein
MKRRDFNRPSCIDGKTAEDDPRKVVLERLVGPTQEKYEKALRRYKRRIVSGLGERTFLIWNLQTTFIACG